MLKLPDGTVRQLVALRRSPAYEALRDVMEALCQVGETELLKLDRSSGVTDSQVLSAHDQARAARAYFEQVQLEIEEQAASLHTPANEEEGEAHGESQPGN